LVDLAGGFVDEWIGRGAAIDLANTVVAVQPGREADLLGSPGDLASWLSLEEPWLGPASGETALRLADFRALRGAVRSLFAAVAEGRPVSPDAVERVNAASAAAPAVAVLDAADPLAPVATERSAAGSRTVEILAALARSAIEAVGGPDRERLRVCPAPRCGRFFVASRAGRRWCTDACGNRARVARHAERRRAGPEAAALDGPPTLRR
jgi:predicted RNA-binding Zn ribbon-like protein